MARERRIAPPDVSEEHPMTTEHLVLPVGTTQLINEIKEAADKLQRDQATRGDLKIISKAVRELRYAFKVFKKYRRQRKVTVFGSARTQPADPSYQQAVELGRLMGQAGWYVVTGAGGGIMEAANVGAGPDMSMGLNIMLPFEQSANRIIANDPKLVNFKYFFTRKLMFVKEVHGIVLFPGGFGTQDEAFETLTLIQTGKRDLMPIVCVEPPGGTYWTDWLAFLQKQLLDRGLISPHDLSLLKITDNVEEAFDEVMSFYCVYNSMRYVKEKLFLRLHQEPPQAMIDRLNHEFKDIIVEGEIVRSAAHPYEADDEHLAHLPRLSFTFNRRDFGRLRELVNVINRELGTC